MDLTAIAEQLDNAVDEPIKRELLPEGFEVDFYNIILNSLSDHWRTDKTNDIFIDIETVPSESMPSIEEIEVPKTIKKPESIQKYKTDPDKIEEQYHKESLQSHKGRILCIGIAINNSEPAVIVGKTEEQIIKSLDKVIGKYRRINWIGFYVKFDLLWIYQRAIKYRCKNIIESINTNRYEGNIIDIIHLMGGCIDYKYRISLDKTLKFLGLESSKKGIDGSLVFQFWKEEKIDEILNYCKDDVKVTRDIYNWINTI